MNTHYLQESVSAVETLLADASAALTRLYATCDLSLHTETPPKEKAVEAAPAKAPAPAAKAPVQVQAPTAAPAERAVAAPVQWPVAATVERPVVAQAQWPASAPAERSAAVPPQVGNRAPELFDLGYKAPASLPPVLNEQPKFYFAEKPPLPTRSLAALARFGAQTAKPRYPAAAPVQAAPSRTAQTYDGLLDKLTAAANQAAFRAQQLEGDQNLAMTLEDLRADLLRLKTA